MAGSGHVGQAGAIMKGMTLTWQMIPNAYDAISGFAIRYAVPIAIVLLVIFGITVGARPNYKP
jgi:hypothetical protein